MIIIKRLFCCFYWWFHSWATLIFSFFFLFFRGRFSVIYHQNETLYSLVEVNKLFFLDRIKFLWQLLRGDCWWVFEEDGYFEVITGEKLCRHGKGFLLLKCIRHLRLTISKERIAKVKSATFLGIFKTANNWNQF